MKATDYKPDPFTGRVLKAEYDSTSVVSIKLRASGMTLESWTTYGIESLINDLKLISSRLSNENI